MQTDEQGERTPDDGELRQMVHGTMSEGWDSVAGRQLLAAVEDHCGRWAPALDRHCYGGYETVEPRDLVTEVWRVLERWPQRVLDAEAPWAYLWNAARNATFVAAAGAAVGSVRLAERHMSLCRTIRPPLRVGPETWRLDRPAIAHCGPPAAGEGWSPALRKFLDLLVENGADRALWFDAIDRAVEVMADARRSYEEHDLRRDPYLRHTLGLRPDQLRALGGLLIGTRRGNRAEQSLLLALHRDRDTRPEHVPGAATRIRVLLDIEPLACSGARARTASARSRAEKRGRVRAGRPGRSTPNLGIGELPSTEGAG